MDLLSLFAQTTELEFYETSWFNAVTLFVFIFVSFLIGRVIAKSSQIARPRLENRLDSVLRRLLELLRHHERRGTGTHGKRK